MQKGVLTLRVGEEAAAFNLIKSMQNIDIDRENCNVVDDVYTHNPDVHNDCNAQIFINEKEINSQYIEDDYSDCLHNSFHFVETVLSLKQNRNDKGENNEKGEIHQETSEEGLMLKELPSHLKYAYLESPKRKPVIISARLSDSCPLLLSFSPVLLPFLGFLLLCCCHFFLSSFLTPSHS